PDMLYRRKFLAREIMGERNRLDLDRARPFPTFTDSGWRHIEVFFLDVMIIDQLFRLRQSFRHRHLMIESAFIDLERSGKRKNPLAMLFSEIPAYAEAGAVADALHLIDNGNGRIARTH